MNRISPRRLRTASLNMVRVAGNLPWKAAAIQVWNSPPSGLSLRACCHLQILIAKCQYNQHRQCVMVVGLITDDYNTYLEWLVTLDFGECQCVCIWLMGLNRWCQVDQMKSSKLIISWTIDPQPFHWGMQNTSGLSRKSFSSFRWVYIPRADILTSRFVVAIWSRWMVV